MEDVLMVILTGLVAGISGYYLKAHEVKIHAKKSLWEHQRDVLINYHGSLVDGINRMYDGYFNVYRELIYNPDYKAFDQMVENSNNFVSVNKEYHKIFLFVNKEEQCRIKAEKCTDMLEEMGTTANDIYHELILKMSDKPYEDYIKESVELWEENKEKLTSRYNELIDNCIEYAFQVRKYLNLEE